MISRRAFTITELICVIALLVFALFFLLPAIARSRARASHIRCVNNLKNVGLAHRIFATDNHDRFVFEVPASDGGTKEFTNSVCPHFQALSNEILSPLLLVCPDRRNKTVSATNWNALQPTNVDYFIGLLASQGHSNSILSGDDGFFINGRHHVHGLNRIASNSIISYPTTFHTEANPRPALVNGDGSVTSMSPKRWAEHLTRAGVATNDFIMP